MKAYRIVNWWKFEMLKNGKLATAKTKMVSIRIKPLLYVRFSVHGHALSADYRRMVKRAGPELAAACDGLYKMLVGLAGNQVREYRGWILDDRQRPLDPGQVAELLCLSERKVSQIFETLTDFEVKLVEILEFPEALRKSFNSSDLSGGSQIKKSGNNQEKKGSPLYETETKDKDKDNRFRSETEKRGVREKSGIVESQGAGGGGENAGQPQALPAAQASVSGSDTAPVPASASERPSVSDADSATVSDSVSQPGQRAGPGAEGPGHLSKHGRFNILLERNETEKKVMQILKINPNNKSDTTTICDIYSQLEHLISGGSPYPLFEYSLTTARQCWRAKKQIAMFVAAMKKPPFCYVPKKMSVVPGKFPQGRNINENLNEGESNE